MVEISVALPALFPETPVEEAIRRAADAGADAVEIFDWESADFERTPEVAEEAGVEIAAIGASESAGTIDQASPALADPADTETPVVDGQSSIRATAVFDADIVVMTVGAAQDQVDPHAQHAALVEKLRRLADTAEEAGATLVIEPLNTRVDHPGYYLTSSYEAYEIVDAVDSPNVKVLYDVYHQQITEGFVIENLRNNVEHIGHMHMADVPGRHEPGTGELNYLNIFAALDEIGYDGYVGLEFSPTIDPEEAIEGVVALAEEAGAR